MITMDSYYHNQANIPHFSGHYRQRGSGFGALAWRKWKSGASFDSKVCDTSSKKDRKRTTSSGSSRTDRSCNKKKKPEAGTQEHR